MTEQMTPRLGMPMLAAGQAGKEITHNEALARLDMLVQPAVIAMGTNIPPAGPAIGQCWIVGDAPTGAWSGHAQALAGWTDGGWRFAMPVEGFAAWCISSFKPISYHNGLWQEGDVIAGRLMIGGHGVVGPRMPAIGDPTGGGTMDDACRTAVVAMLGAMRQHGLIAS